MCNTNQEINFLSKGHSTKGLEIPSTSNLKIPACASKLDVLELVTLQYAYFIYQN